MQKLVIGFLLGCLSGGLVVFLLQATPEIEESAADAAAAAEKRVLETERALADMNAERGKLRAENSRLIKDTVPVVTEVDPTTEKSGAKGMEAFMEMAMAMGKEQGRSQVDAKVAQLVERLGLSDEQAALVHAAMMERLKMKDKATGRIMAGEATIADLTASDEDNFHKLDAEMDGMLNDEQRAGYEAVRNEREVARVEKKTNEELQGLRKVANLTEVQQEQAWQAFVDLNAASPPDEIPEGTTVPDVLEFIGGEFDKRSEALGPILTPTQLEAYLKQQDGQRQFISQIITSGLVAE
jgi:hypothetical protein